MGEQLQQMTDTLVNHSVFLLLVLPVVGAVLVLVSAWFGNDVVRRTALTNVVLSAFLSVLMVANYELPQTSGDSAPKLMQMASESGRTGNDESRSGSLSAADSSGEEAAGKGIVRIAVGVDGVSLWFVAAVAFLMIAAVLAHWNEDEAHPSVFFAWLLLMQAALVGLFAALDVVFFCICLEFTSLAAFFLIGRWGGAERRRIVQTFFLYQLAGSLLVFLGLIALVLAEGELSFSIVRITTELAKSDAAQHWQLARPLILLPLVLGFAIKAALFPFHRWLPTAHTEAPTAIGILLCGAVVNIGLYGCVRFLIPVFQSVGDTSGDTAAAWAILSAVIAGLLALAQSDMRRTVAYAVVSHAGFCVAGILSQSPAGVSGGVLRAVSLGLAFGGIAFLLGAIHRRYDTFEIKAFGGMARRYPRLAFFFAAFVLAAIAAPPLGGFPATLTTLAGIFRGAPSDSAHVAAAVFALGSVLLVASALVWMVQRIFFGNFREPVLDPHAFSADRSAARNDNGEHGSTRGTGDLAAREVAAMTPLLAIVLWIGLSPQFLLERIGPSVKRFLPEAGSRVARPQERRAWPNVTWRPPRLSRWSGRATRAEDGR